MKHTTWMKIAQVVADESKCISHHVGSVIVKNDRIVSTGYNGTPAGQANCCDVNSHLVYNGQLQHWKTEDAKDEHHNWSIHHEIHAEMNAILYSSKEDRVGATLYCTLQPCYTCSLLIAGSGITRVIYETNYARTPPAAAQVLKDAGVQIYSIYDRNLPKK